MIKILCYSKITRPTVEYLTRELSQQLCKGDSHLAAKTHLQLVDCHGCGERGDSSQESSGSSWKKVRVLCDCSLLLLLHLLDVELELFALEDVSVSAAGLSWS